MFAFCGVFGIVFLMVVFCFIVDYCGCGFGCAVWFVVVVFVIWCLRCLCIRFVLLGCWCLGFCLFVFGVDLLGLGARY